MARRQVFTVRLYDQGTIGQEEKVLLRETKAFSVNASRGAGESLVRTHARDTRERFTRVPYSRKVEHSVLTYHAREDWVGDRGTKVFTWVEGVL